MQKNNLLFKRLQRERLFFSLILTFIMLFAYFSFILLVSFNKQWLAQTIGSSYLTIALPIGISIIILAWLLTGIYVLWANKRYDTQVEVVKKSM